MYIISLLYFLYVVPEDFDFNPNSGHHGDRNHRLELKKSCIEYIAPSEYMVSHHGGQSTGLGIMGVRVHG